MISLIPKKVLVLRDFRIRQNFFGNRTGTAATEFAIVAPVFLLMILGMLGFGIYLGASHSVQQLASDVARATIPGVTEKERQEIAANFINLNIDSYAFLKADNMKVDVKDSETVSDLFVVEIQYDASHLPIWGLADFAPMPSKTITASSAIKTGGYGQ
ncbi:pilus assembly protein [Hyphococcus flavus]|uniref:Pilus assembly protein n=1 Tax=Hyphococcus flavus TaxID=1866326 RepID=A0AAF0CCC5_9PROT|nr:TadE/TadG family type IV pilus assembly protein [Hyphococcus flavus]WDI33145.1 pilus assembly protein [Hyphococcus flavus]